MKKKKYFPHNWKAIKNTPSKYFRHPDGDITFEDFMDWRVGGWEIPSSIDCIIREEDIKTGKIKEYIYERPACAQKRIDKIINDQSSQFTICCDAYVETLLPINKSNDKSDKKS